MVTHTLVMGTQFGDEGKGKIVDLLTPEHDIIVRYGGADNAGHTVRLGDKKYTLKVIPSGILYPEKLKIIAKGVALNPENFLNEIETLEGKGVELSPDNLKVSRHTHLILPYHIELDGIGGKEIDTTRKGVGPCYEDRVARRGIMLCDLKNEKELEKKVEKNFRLKTMIIKGYTGAEPKLKLYDTIRWLQDYGDRTLEFMADVSPILEEAASKKRILCEGHQGWMLSINYGTYPFVTSSDPGIGGVYSSLGVSDTKLKFKRRIGVAKVAQSRVGGGPFPTELGDSEKIKNEEPFEKDEKDIEGKKRKEKFLRDMLKAINRGKASEQDIGKYFRHMSSAPEFGTVTRRPRRTSWYDSRLSEYAVRTNGLDELAITKPDVLSGINILYICKAYKLGNEIIEKITERTIDEFHLLEPVYMKVPGWSEDIFGITKWKDLPENARDYVKQIEKLVGARVTMVSTGPEREHTIFR